MGKRDEVAHDDTVPGAWLDDTTQAFATERAFDEAREAERAEATLVDGEFEPDKWQQAVRASALLTSLVLRGSATDHEAVRRAAVVTLADPHAPGTPHRCARCGRTHYLDSGDPDWLGAGREDVLCHECTAYTGARWDAALERARRREVLALAGRTRWRAQLRRFPVPAPVALPPPARTRRKAIAAPAKPAGDG